MEHALLQQLQQRPLLCDGAMGTLLYARGVKYEQCLSEFRTIFREQIDALQDGGAELLILEACSSLAELRQAILAAKESGLPIVAQMSFYEDGHPLSGQSAARVAAVLSDLRVDVMGANCSVGPAVTLDALEEMIAEANRYPDGMKSTTHMFSAQPNAGLPTRIDNRF